MKNPNTPMPPEAMMTDAAMPPAMPAEGEVMMSIPKSTFDQLHGIVVQLAEAIDALAVDIERQAAASGEGAMMPPAPASPTEDADLAAFAQELSRGMV
jgi:hypothetical protein